MNTKAIALSQLQAASATQSTARLADFVVLMKPRVMSLAVFTALVGLMIAPGHPDPIRATVAILAIAGGAGAAGMLNMWYDSDIDAVMSRTARRPIPRGAVSPGEALAFGLVLAGASAGVLALATNIRAAALLGFTIFFYVVVYTIWLKRRTPQNIVIGGAAGALPPVIGWAAATGDVALEPLVLFLIIFLWTPPHFWALALTRADEYARAGVPMLPVVVGRGATVRQIIIYGLALGPASMLPWVLGFAGPMYAVTAAVCGAILVWLAWQLRAEAPAEGQLPAHRLFAFSIFYLFVIFATLLAESGIQRLAPMPSRSAWVNAPSRAIALTPKPLRVVIASTNFHANEV